MNGSPVSQYAWPSVLFNTAILNIQCTSKKHGSLNVVRTESQHDLQKFMAT